MGATRVSVVGPGSSARIVHPPCCLTGPESANQAGTEPRAMAEQQTVLTFDSENACPRWSRPFMYG
jgi:hypothetical protein